MFQFFWRETWTLSSMTRDQTYTPCIRRQSLNCWTTREVPDCIFYSSKSKSYWVSHSIFLTSRTFSPCWLHLSLMTSCLFRIWDHWSVFEIISISCTKFCFCLWFLRIFPKFLEVIFLNAYGFSAASQVVRWYWTHLPMQKTQETWDHVGHISWSRKW